MVKLIPIHQEKGHNAPLDGLTCNQIFLSDPNSGKTYGLQNKFAGKVFELSYQDPRNTIEWKKEVLLQNILGQYHVGRILSAIATATVNPSNHFYIFADEVGMFHLDWILGSNLKKVFKDSQKVDCTNFEDIELELMSVRAFKAMGEQIKQAHPTQVTSFKEGDHDFHLWIPKNLCFIFCANYEEPILQSLIDKKGWGSTGERFIVKHFYASSEQYMSSFIPDNMEDGFTQVASVNDEVRIALNRIMEEKMSPVSTHWIKTEMIVYRVLVPTFHPLIKESVFNGSVDWSDCLKIVTDKIDNMDFYDEEDKMVFRKAVQSLKSNDQ